MQSERPIRKAGIARRRKIALACEPCRERKSRCDGQKPICSSCVRRALPLNRCVYKAENSRSACSDEYIQGLHQRIIELERSSSATIISPPAQTSDRAVPTSVTENPAAGSRDRPAIEPGAEPLARSETQSVSEQHPRPQQPVIEARCNTEARTLYAMVHDQRSSLDPASNVTGMGAMTTANDHESSPSQKAQYFGSSSSASLMTFVAPEPEQQSFLGLATPQSNPPYQPIGESQAWSRDTPSLAKGDGFVLPPRDFADHLLGCFWDRVYYMYPFFDRRSFEEAYENLWMPTHRAIHQITELDVGLGDRMNSGPTSIVFNCALNIMFALGCHLTDISIQDRERTVYQFFLRAKNQIGLDMIDIQSIGVVQTLLIVALFLQSTPYPHRCWNSIGTACRLALGIGLHDAQLEKFKGPLEREIHRRTWHGCVMLDMTVSMTYGRPSMTAHLKSVPLPGNYHLKTRQETEEHSLATFYVSTIKLYSILDRILSDIYKAWRGQSRESTLEGKEPELDIIVQLENQLLQYKFNVPPPLRWTGKSTLASETSDHSILNRQRNVLHLRYLYLQLLLYRPTFTQLCSAEKADSPHRNSDSLHSFMLDKCALGCIQAAVDLISLVHETHQTSTADTWWYNGFYTSTAAMILIMSYKCRLCKDYENPKIGLTWKKAEAVLQHMASFSTSARNTLSFFQNIWSQLLPNSYASRHSPPNDRLASNDPCVGYEQAGIQAPFCTGEPFNFDEGVLSDELGFLGPFEFNDFQDWFPQVGI